MTDAVLQRFTELFGPEFEHGKPFDLAKLRVALDTLGAPQTELPRTIHVAGTNGKGSTIAFMRAIAEAAGLRVHAFTKPHLFKLNERFLVAGALASDGALMAAAERVARIDASLTQFDAQVAVAFLLFSETSADLALIETGMGGRDDSTNVIDAPAVSVITAIGLDHQNALGATLAEIAAHKAGIIRRIVTTVTARQEPEAMSVIDARAAEIGGDLLRQGEHWDAFESNGRLCIQTTTSMRLAPLPRLAGRHQIDNAGLACVALLHSGIEWPASAFADGIANAAWPARLQPLTRGQFSAPVRDIGGEVWVDGGHNAHAAAALAHTLNSMKSRRGGANIGIVGLRRRKDAAAFVTALAGAVTGLIAVPLAEDHVPPEEIAALASHAGVNASIAPTLAAAMQRAAQLPAPRVLICGSFLLVAEALSAESA
ncbi:dihydrofolate synthase [alpha proteobacterium U9-1i]|nr:dihydrofolate synthase [alpha proteobacterium U9-1i]